jgi:esterase
MELFYRKIGEGKPVIILHGVFGSSDNWFTTSKMIADAGFSVYTPDVRNHGQSPRSEAFSYDLMAADLAQFIDDHQLEKPIIIGHSMGGKITMQFAMLYPEKFSKLIVVDIAPRFYPAHHGHIIQGLSSIDLTTLKNRQEAENQVLSYIPNVGERQFLLKNLYRNEAGKFEWRINLPVIAKEIYQVGSELHDTRIINEPTLFIRGSESGYIHEEDIQQIKSIFINAEIETIEGASHWVQADKPKEFVACVLKFADASIETI